ncbi:MAG: hypothetical protein E5X14_07380 [Mesorhizobium sp.]|nr:MAG: hypothetical protein E5X14_07380 [Mesorhizobium sp.]
MARETPATCNNYLRYVSKYGLSFSALPLRSSSIPEANKYPPIASIFAMSMVPMAPLAFLQKMPVVQRRVVSVSLFAAISGSPACFARSTAKA